MARRDQDPRKVLMDSLDLVHRVVVAVCRRHNAPPEFTDEFHAEVRLALVEDDYEIIRRFRGESTLRSYLLTVVGNLFYDRAKARWGRWRPSAHARRRSSQVEELEALVYRDGYSVDEAVRIVAEQSAGVSADELWDELEKIPLRDPPPKEVRLDLESLEKPDPRDPPDTAMAERQLEVRTEAALERAMGHLDFQERTLFKLHFRDGFTLARIARVFGLDQRRLYRRVATALETVRTALEAEGVTPPDAAEVMESPSTLRIDWHAVPDDPDPDSEVG